MGSKVEPPLNGLLCAAHPISTRLNWDLRSLEAGSAALTPLPAGLSCMAGFGALGVFFALSFFGLVVPVVPVVMGKPWVAMIPSPVCWCIIIVQFTWWCCRGYGRSVYIN